MTPDHKDMEQTSITFKCSEALADIIRRVAFDLDKSASEVIRACIIVGHPLVRDIRGIDRVDIEDIRPGKNGNK